MMKLILTVVTCLFYSFGGFCQSPDFVLVMRDSSYLSIFKSECITHSLDIEFGKMEIKLGDSILSSYIKKREVLERFDASTFIDINKQNYESLHNQRIFLLYCTHDPLSGSFEETSEVFYYIKFKGQLFIFYNHFGMFNKSTIVETGDPLLNSMIEEMIQLLIEQYKFKE